MLSGMKAGDIKTDTGKVHHLALKVISDGACPPHT